MEEEITKMKTEGFMTWLQTSSGDANYDKVALALKEKSVLDKDKKHQLDAYFSGACSNICRWKQLEPYALD